LDSPPPGENLAEMNRPNIEAYTNIQAYTTFLKFLDPPSTVSIAYMATIVVYNKYCSLT
jgi:hypothetical protein